ncbi:hypothetical protein DH2020_023758 [Rehmannia glutinosa]|uniref:CCHC-type domain-containing protein n=1 Tax=Rehmannia glutinosa TaxID=99300 RepID=A0ABR0WB56_REHGL
MFNQHLEPEDFVNECYIIDTYKKVYESAIFGIDGEELWGQSIFIPPLPPDFGRGAGRPQKARRRENDEPAVKKEKKANVTLKLKRRQVTTKCGKCGLPGHNARKCNNPGAAVGEGSSNNAQRSKERPMNQPNGPEFEKQGIQFANEGESETLNATDMQQTGGTCKRRLFIPPRPARNEQARPTILAPLEPPVQDATFSVNDVLPTQQSQVHQTSPVEGPSMYTQSMRCAKIHLGLLYANNDELERTRIVLWQKTNVFLHIWTSKWA